MTSFERRIQVIRQKLPDDLHHSELINKCSEIINKTNIDDKDINNLYKFIICYPEILLDRIYPFFIELQRWCKEYFRKNPDKRIQVIDNKCRHAIFKLSKNPEMLDAVFGPSDKYQIDRVAVTQDDKSRIVDSYIRRNHSPININILHVLFVYEDEQFS